MAKQKEKLKVIPLGGLGEVGKNMTIFEYKNDIIIVDSGLRFPDDDMYGIDMVIPDLSYIIKNRNKIRGIVLTHGHEDHIGALPYLLKEVNVPVYATKLTLGLVENKLKEHGILRNSNLKVVKAKDVIQIGEFSVEFIHVSHSIADSVALAIKCEVATVVHTGDFKIDYTPIDNKVMDLHRLAELGKEGVTLLMADSTNVERPGYSMSESTVGQTFLELFRGVTSRIIVATFASNIHRVQQIINAAIHYNRKVVVSGRSMVNIVSVAEELGYINIPDGVLIDLNDIKKYPDEQLVIITTGSQGEPMSGLSRMSISEHKKVEISKGDLVIISATPIPGNEKSISQVINQLYKLGANVIYSKLADVHVSGHACQEELKLIHTLIRPKYFLPVHGEYRMLMQHAQLAESLGMPQENIFIGEIGSVLEVNRDFAKINGKVQSGQTLVDGLGVGDVGNIVLRDRKHLSQDGLFIVVVSLDKEKGKVVAGPDVISRGFVYVRESGNLIEEAKAVVRQALTKCEESQVTDWSTIKGAIRDTLRQFLYEKTKRKPMILPIIMEV
ncbi:ribonuclease J [Garciella nitratireducens]|uniref:Ribonuclease J n=1 Tax=Garciella nitratireducens DSM 15102 TaxID=1121911 RepID=A0A1T4K8C4_9FIRM|nr:ribonuclease J [Garciella nitratireducens]SJZ38573.1 ribonuclease J [Garciella nitratireducens DSM 15102]